MTSLRDILGAGSVFVGLSVTALLATFVVAIGLYLEYERRELRVFGISKTTPLGRRSRRTSKLNRPARKQVGGFLVVVGVVLEFVFGLGAFLSATIREGQNELLIAELKQEASPRQFAKEQAEELAKSWHKYAGRAVVVVSNDGDEGRNFTWQLETVLKKAGLILSSPTQPFSARMSAGVWVEGSWADFEMLATVVDSLNAIGINADLFPTCGQPLGAPKELSLPTSCDFRIDVNEKPVGLPPNAPVPRKIYFHELHEKPER